MNDTKYTVEVKRENQTTVWWEPLYHGNPAFDNEEEATEAAESSAIGMQNALRVVRNGIVVKIIA